jgi:hypothetical protein
MRFSAGSELMCRWKVVLGGNYTIVSLTGRHAKEEHVL